MDATQLPFQTKLSTITDALVRCGWTKDNPKSRYFRMDANTVEIMPQSIKIYDNEGVTFFRISLEIFTTDQIILCLLSIGVLHHSDFDTVTNILLTKVKNG